MRAISTLEPLRVAVAAMLRAARRWRWGIGAAVAGPTAAFLALVALWFSGATAQGPAVLHLWAPQPAPAITPSYRLDGLSLPFALAFTMLALAAALAIAEGYLLPAGATAHRRAYSQLALLGLLAGLLSFVLAADLLTLYASWEVAILFAALSLVTHRGAAARDPARAWQALSIPGLALLLGIVIVGRDQGTFILWTNLRPAHVSTAAFLLILLAILARAAQWPWAPWPLAVSAGSREGLMLVYGGLLGGGLYAALRLQGLGELAGAPWWNAALLAFGGTTAIVGFWGALGQRRLRLLLAHALVGQAGFAMLSLGYGGPWGLAAGSFQALSVCLAAGLAAAALGRIEAAEGSDELRALRGLVARQPYSTALFLVGLGAVVGLPPFGSFAAKVALHLAAASGPLPLVLVALAASLAGILTFLVLLEVFLDAGAKPRREHLAASTVAAALLGLANLALGLYPAYELTLGPLVAPATVWPWEAARPSLLLVGLLLALLPLAAGLWLWPPRCAGRFFVLWRAGGVAPGPGPVSRPGPEPIWLSAARHLASWAYLEPARYPLGRVGRAIAVALVAAAALSEAVEERQYMALWLLAGTVTVFIFIA